jgi:hypothetical protein
MRRGKVHLLIYFQTATALTADVHEKRQSA